MKKRIPLIVHESLEKFLPYKDNIFKVINPDNFVMKVIDIEEDSEFYFNIEEVKNENEFTLIIDYKPYHIQTTSNRKITIESKSIDGFFEKWIELLEKYKTVSSFYDDPIVDGFAEEYYAEFEILEEEAEKPLKTDQIIFLDEYLENIHENIEKFLTEKNNSAIQEIKNDVNILRENLTSQSKKWIAKKLSKIWAKIAKQGTKFIKEFLTETRKQVIQKGVKFLVEQGPEIIKAISESAD